MRLNSKPVKVYKSTISCVMYVLLFSAGIAFCNCILHLGCYLQFQQ